VRECSDVTTATPRTSIARVLLGVFTFFSFTAACVFGILWYLARTSSPSSAPLVTPRGDLSQTEQSTIEIFRNAAPSVVYITRLAVRSDPFRRNLSEIPEGTGSGFLWDDRGHVVTNFHVIQGASGARVTLSDRSTWPAELVGTAPSKDLAVLRIAAPRAVLRALPIGASNDLLVGQNVFAIGNPFGLDHTLSTGVISGLEREIMGAGGRPIQGVIQTDAAINPGNSGGPLLDSAGRLIGVNTAIFSTSGNSAGIGFAVPVDTVRLIVPQLIEHGRIVQPGLGVNLADPSAIGLAIEGALVLEVVPGSPAQQAGILPTQRDRFSGALILGDIILAIDGERVRGAIDVYRNLDRHQVGDTVRLTLQRGTQQAEVNLRLAAIASD
jgi:S1-C subfamily serine protease